MFNHKLTCFFAQAYILIGAMSAPQRDFFESQAGASAESTQAFESTNQFEPIDKYLGSQNYNQTLNDTQVAGPNLDPILSQGNPNLHSLYTNLTGLPLDFVIMGSLGLAGQSKSNSRHDDSNADTNCVEAVDKSKSYKIVGGQEVERVKKYPWIAAIHTDSFCTASIISETKILTAKHCTYAHPSSGGREYVPSDITVSVGSIYLNAPDDVYHVQSILRPPNENMDFAILVLNTSLPSCHTSIKPVCLAETPSEDLNPGTIVTALGWGRPSNDSMKTSPTLKEAELSVTSDAECDLIGYGDDNPYFFCAEYSSGATCQGDSGGPVVTLKDGKYFQVGVTAYGVEGYSCGEGVALGFASTTTQEFIDLAKPFHTC